MKKLLLGLLALSTVAFGYSHEDTTATMKINALIVQPLTIVSNGDINLGVMTRGEYKTGESSFKIEGEPGATVLTTIKGEKFLRNSKNQSDMIPIGVEFGDLSRNLDENGLNILPMKVHVTVPTEHKNAGLYQGEIIASVRYN